MAQQPRVSERIYLGPETITCRGTAGGDEVLITLPKTPSRRDQEAIERERKALEALGVSAEVVDGASLGVEAGAALLTPNRPGLTLTSLVRSGGVPLDTFLRIANGLVERIDELHQKHLIH